LKLLGDAGDDEKPVISEVLSDAVQLANEKVSDEIPEGGTTVTAAAIVGDLVYIAHVGDSRAYLLTGDDLEQITRDHSLVQRLIELDQLTPDEAAAHPQRNVLYRAIGQSEHIEIDTATRRLPPGSCLMLCSDGLWNQVPESKILQVVKSSATPQEACDRLVTLANESGGADNVTVVIIQVPG
jgi:serine/threonine protein phosphatase PrpC